MKHSIWAILAFVLLSACAPTQPRTGSIVINKFSIEGYKTDNPFQVKKDAVEMMRDELYSGIIAYVKKDTKMTIVPDCTTGDFELTGRFEEINSKIDSHWRVVTITVNQLFDVDIDGQLKRCRTGEKLVEFGPSKSGESMANIINHLAKKIVSKISKEPAKAPAN